MGTGIGTAKGHNSLNKLFEKAKLKYNNETALSTVGLYLLSFGLTAGLACLFILAGFCSGAVAAHAAPLNQRLSFIAIGFVSGATVAAASVRILLFVLNIALGASDYLIRTIREELQSYQPVRKFTDGMKDTVDETKLDKIVKNTCEVVGVHAKTLEEGELKSKANDLKDNIHKHGKDAMKSVIEWYMQKSGGTGQPCLSLFDAGFSEFACHERELAALSMLDMTLFLLHLYDPHYKICGNFRTDDGRKWEPSFELKRVHVSNPHIKMCTLSDSGEWQIKEFFTVPEEELVLEVEGEGAPGPELGTTGTLTEPLLH